MSRYRKVEVKTWNDEKFQCLSPLPPSGQSLWLYLMTGPHTGPVPGLFAAGRAGMAERLNWEQDAFDTCFGEILEQGMVEFDAAARLMWLPRGLRYNMPANPNVILSWTDEIQALPNCELKQRALASMRAQLVIRERNPDLGKGKPFVNAFDKACGNRCRKQKQKLEQQTEVRKELPTRAPKAIDPDAMKVAEALRAAIVAMKADAKVPGSLMAWAEDARLMLRRDSRPLDVVGKVIAWATADPFWRSNILSVAKLRKHFDRLELEMAKGASRPNQGSRKEYEAKPTEERYRGNRELSGHGGPTGPARAAFG